MSQQTEAQKDTVTVTVDGRAIEARRGELVIAAAERHGVYIPRFCWHPRMKPVGMCRMCLVEIKGPRGFALQPACFIPVADDMEVLTQSEKVKKAQDGVLEFLLINHPLDCPVCDRGGECPLQDQTFGFGPGESRFIEEKRHFEKPIPISDLVALDRERCIQCARCTRFAAEVAGDPLIDFVDRGDQVQVLTFPDDPFTSYFSGNTVQICPVGALTATPYRFRARPWDLEQVESTCTACSVGCRVAAQSSSDRLVRYLGIDSEPVNHGWLCDKGRFSYEAVDHDERLGRPMVRREGDGLTECSWAEAFETVTAELRNIIDLHGPGSVAVLGGSRLTNEDAYAWVKLAKGVIGTDSVDCQLGDGLPAEAVLGLPRATIDEACSASTVLLLAPDLKEELPVLYLRLRDAAVEGKVPIVELTPQRTGMSRYATTTVLYRPGEAADAARALVEGSDGAGDLLKQGPVVVVLGRPSLAESAQSIVDAAGVLAAGLEGVRFLPALRRANVLGALEMGLAPGLLPGRVSLDQGREWFREEWGRVPEDRGLDAGGVLTAAAEGKVQGLFLLGADPLSDFPDLTLARRGVSAAGYVVAVDLFLTETARHADAVLAVSGPGETSGTTTNLEGRVTRLNQKVTAPGTARPAWMIAAELAARIGEDLGFDSLGSLWAEVERLAPSYRGLTQATLSRPEHRDGIVVPPNSDDLAPVEAADSGMRPVEAVEVRAVATQSFTGSDIQPVPGPEDEPAAAAAEAPPLLTWTASAPPSPPPPVDAYSLRLVVGRKLYDAGVVVQHCPSLAHLTPGTRLGVNPFDLDRLGLRTGDRAKVTSARGSAVFEVEVDEGVPRGSAALTFNQPGEAAASSLIDVTQPVTEVRVETV